MKQIFIKKQDKKSLLLFFAGWGMDENIVKNYEVHHADFMICYDYKTLDFDKSLIEKYQHIRVLAWSMGVWNAAQVLEGVACTEATAINGTLFPIDDIMGIPDKIFQGTLDNFSVATLQKFQKRMCGNQENYQLFQSVQPKRSVEDLHEELKAIQANYEEYTQKRFPWNVAVVGKNDNIFPSQNQLNAWKSVLNVYYDVHHYDYELFKFLIEDADISAEQD